jgi:dCMP deaminase
MSGPSNIHRINWQDYFMNIAHQVKLRSPDTHRQVGAVMVSIKDRHIISTGFNGLKKGSNDDIDWDNRELVHSIVIHAETNCILYAQSRFEDSILYITTSPCMSCIKLIAAANIKSIIYDEPYKDIDQVEKLCIYFGIELNCIKKV